MRFIKFPVSSTNIFPLANSTSGGQLLSEWNIRSRETVGTHSKVEYEIGHSYTHSLRDFKIRQHVDSSGTPISSTGIMISEGSAIVNGHFVQSLAPIVVDLAEANAELKRTDRSPLSGQLAIGLVAMYSTERTMAGAMVPEKKSQINGGSDEIDDNTNEMYYGVQVVILPISEIKTPSDVPVNQDAVNCHLLLGTFEYSQSTVSNVQPNKDRIAYIDGDRISNIDEILSSQYVSKGGLNPKRIYSMSGKLSHPSTEAEPWSDTWCDTTDSLVVWTPKLKTTSLPPSRAAEFQITSDKEKVYLNLPVKQVDGMQDSEGNPEYYSDIQLYLPNADYGSSTPGVVTNSYTQNIKLLAQKLSTIYQFSKGKQVGYFDSLSNKSDLPKINNAWNVGDYVLVKEDYTSEVGSFDTSGPSTMYAVLPGYITGISYYGETLDTEDIPSGLTGVEIESVSIDDIPVKKTSIVGEDMTVECFKNLPISGEAAMLVLSGSMMYEVKYEDLFISNSDETAETSSFTITSTDGYTMDINRTALVGNKKFNTNYSTYSDANVTFRSTSVTIKKPQATWADCGISVGDTIVVVFDKTANAQSGGVSSATMELQSGIDFNPITGKITNEIAIKAMEYIAPKAVYTYFELISTDLFSDFKAFRGEPGKDYFVAVRTEKPEDGSAEDVHVHRYYFQVTNSMPNDWSDALQITGRISLATESSIGGFYNSSSSDTDQGYVYITDDGKLKLRDYALLRAGTLAYQLGEDIEEFGAGEPISYIQETLDEAINDRIAFPSAAQLEKSDNPNVIHVTINLADDTPSDDEDTGTRNIYIRNIDSRFNTAVYFHFNGTATSKTIINFVDCERIRIDSNICGTAMGSQYSKGPIINIYRCGLYYDPSVMNYNSTCERPYDTDFSVYDYENDVYYTDYYPSWFTGMKDIKLWYQAYEDTDPRLTVDNMTVSELDVALESEDVDFWSPLAPNDNHYSTALSSLTFAGDGTIVKCGLLVASTTTTNIISSGESIILGKFSLPQGQGLSYPSGCLTRQLKITGTFTTAYYTAAGSSQGWHVSDTSFTAVTEKYNRYTAETEVSGSIAFHEKVSIVQADFGEDVQAGGIAPWSADSYHTFYGGIYC